MEAMTRISVRQPKYVTVVNAIQQRIEDGVYPPGSAVPTEMQLCAEFGASRPVIVRALGILQQDGWLDSEQGKGRFVREGRQSPLVAVTVPVEHRVTGQTSFGDPEILVTVTGQHPMAGFRLLLRSTASMDHMKQAALDGQFTYLVYGYPEPDGQMGDSHGGIQATSVAGAVDQAAGYIGQLWMCRQASSEVDISRLRTAVSRFARVLNGEVPADMLWPFWREAREAFLRAELAMAGLSKQ
jgi:DNA-binding transcriptional regulator YhcF (GntR family)